jgi:hypothetical protein
LICFSSAKEQPKGADKVAKMPLIAKRNLQDKRQAADTFLKRK